jgi:hypothetical protein
MKISKKQADPIVKLAFPEYKGRKYFVEFTDKVVFYDTNWGGGTRNKYVIVRSDGKKMEFNAPAPWVNPVEGKTFEIPEGVAVVRWAIFCGKDCGVTISLNPDHKMPEQIEQLCEKNYIEACHESASIV